MRRSLLVAVLVLAGACYRDAAPRRAAPAPAPAPGPRAARFAADPLAFLPHDAEIVLHLDAVQLRRSATWPRLEALLRGRAGAVLAELQRACGFDPLATIRRMTVGMKQLDAPRPVGVVVVRGLDRAATLACIERARAQPSEAAATVDRGIVTVPGTADRAPLAFGFADATTLVLSTGPGVSAAVLRDVLERGAPLRRSRAFMELFAALEHGRAMWFVVNGTAKLFDQTAAMGLRPRAVFGALDLATGVDAMLRMRVDTPDAAAQLAAMVQGQLGPMQGFVSRIEVTADDRDLVVALALSSDQLDTLLTLLGASPGSP